MRVRPVFIRLFVIIDFSGAVQADRFGVGNTFEPMPQPFGNMQQAGIVVYDEREGSPTKGEVNEFFIGEHSPSLLQIPKGLWHGFKCISETEAICINCPTEIYNHQEPDEFRADAHKNHIPYDWNRKDG